MNTFIAAVGIYLFTQASAVAPRNTNCLHTPRHQGLTKQGQANEKVVKLSHDGKQAKVNGTYATSENGARKVSSDDELLTSANFILLAD
jgi:hypothetical protein